MPGMTTTTAVRYSSRATQAEVAFRQTLAQTRGDLLPILSRPGAAVLFGLAAIMLVLALYTRYRSDAGRRALALAGGEE